MFTDPDERDAFYRFIFYVLTFGTSAAIMGFAIYGVWKFFFS